MDETSETMQTTVVRAAQGTDAGRVGIAGIGTDAATTVISLPWWQLLAVRVGRAYLGFVFGLLGLDMTGQITLTSVDGLTWIVIGAALYKALIPTVLVLGWNVFEYLKKFDVTAPQWRG